MRRKGDVPKEMQGLLEEILGEVSFQYQELGRHMDIPDWDLKAKKAIIGEIISKEMTETEQKSKRRKRGNDPQICTFIEEFSGTGCPVCSI